MTEKDSLFPSKIPLACLKSNNEGEQVCFPPFSPPRQLGKLLDSFKHTVLRKNNTLKIKQSV